MGALQAVAGQHYVIDTFSLGDAVDTYLSLYDTDGTTLLASNDDHGETRASEISWQAPTSGTYYVMVQDWNPNTSGCGTLYNLLVATQSTVLGHVIWEGRPAQLHLLQQLPITLTLRSGSTKLEYEGLSTDANGFFTPTVGPLASGTYDWRVKGPKFLANSGTLTITPGNIAFGEMGAMKAGDANDDNLVGVLDFNILKLTFGRGIGEPGYDDRADFTGDQVVRVTDFNLLKVNFGLGGAPPLRTNGS